MNKILIKLDYPAIDQEFEMFIPINKTVAKVLTLIQKAIAELNVGHVPIKNDIALYIKSTGELLAMTDIVKDTNIKHGDTLVIL